MADLFSSLVGEVLGAAPQITPLLPPLFAPWPGLPSTDAAPPLQTEISAPAASTGDDPAGHQNGLPASFQGSFPPPLVDPSQPAAPAPLPTFRQMAAPQPRPEPPFQPGQGQAAHRSPETAGFEPGQPEQPARPSPLPDSIMGSTPPSPAQPAAVTQTFPERSAPPLAPAALPGALPSAALPASPRPSAADEPAQTPSRLPELLTTPTPTPAIVPEQPVSPPAPAAPSTHSQPALEATPPPARAEPVETRNLPRVNQPEPVEPRPEDPRQTPAFTTQSIPARPALIRARPTLASAKGQGQSVETGRPATEESPVEAPPRQVESQLTPDAARPEHAKHQADSGQAQAAPQKGQDMAPVGQPEGTAALPAPFERPVQPALERRVAAPDSSSGRAIAPPALTPTQNLPVPGKQPQAAPAGAPVQPAAPADLPAAPPAAPGPREVNLPTRAAGAREQGSTTRLALSPERAQEILPAPDPAQAGQRQADALTSAKLPTPPAARPPIDLPEPAPTVHVTIGRVVVRVSAPVGETPSKRVDLPRPRLSLDHYLKGKKEGEA